MASDTLQNYIRGQQVSLQWLPVLRAMASELSAQNDAKALRTLFFKIGERFATDTSDLFEGAQSLAQLEERLNDFWSRINWGWVELKEVKDYIEISHHASPLSEAFGDESLEWSIGLFEGFYQSVFSVLGASETMTVRGAAVVSGDMDVQLRFGRHST